MSYVSRSILALYFLLGFRCFPNLDIVELNCSPALFKPPSSTDLNGFVLSSLISIFSALISLAAPKDKAVKLETILPFNGVKKPSNLTVALLSSPKLLFIGVNTLMPSYIFTPFGFILCTLDGPKS